MPDDMITNLSVQFPETFPEDIECTFFEYAAAESQAHAVTLARISKKTHIWCVARLRLSLYTTAFDKSKVIF